MGAKWVENYGLVFEGASERGSNRSDIVLIGSKKSGKSELVNVFFFPPPPFISSNRPPIITTSPPNRSKFIVDLPDIGPQALRLSIICTRGVEYVKTTAEFTEKSVFLFCYDVDNEESFDELEATWVPALLQRGMQNLYYLSVGIEHDPVTNPEVDAETRQRERVNLRERARRLIEQHGGRSLECSLSDRDSVVNVFQTALDTTIPRTSGN